MFRKIDAILNTITMYRLVLYGLLCLAGIAVTLSLLGILHYDVLYLFLSLLVLSTVSFLVNILLARIYGLPTNHESSLISALILFFILSPPRSASGFIGIAIAAALAVASKYMLVWRGAHIFNPAAFAALIISLTGLGLAGWWVASKILIIPMVIIGLLVLKKIRRFQLFFAFFIPAAGLLLLNGTALDSILFSFPVIFFGTIMLTEPGTMPGTKFQRLAFGWIIGLIFGAQLQLFSISTSPHLALLIGNCIALIFAVRTGAVLTLVKKIQLSPTTYDFSFAVSRKMNFSPGQYIEVTLPGVGIDSRGNRRSFTVASGPEESQLHIGVKFYDKSSQFKNTLQDMQLGDAMLGAHVAGDFLLPDDTRIPLVFLAGGIGITPFLSHIRHMLITEEYRNITLHHFINNENEKVYQSVLETAKSIGVKVVYHVGGTSSLADQDIIANRHAQWYISGPPPMVSAYKKRLQVLSIKKIKTDYFSGY